MKTVNQLRTELGQTIQREMELRKELYDAMVAAIQSAAKDMPTKVIRSAKIPFTVTLKFSDILGHPWNPVFYDKDQTIRIVLDYLSKRDPLEWKDILEEKLSSSTEGTVKLDRQNILNAGIIKQIAELI